MGYPFGKFLTQVQRRERVFAAAEHKGGTRDSRKVLPCVRTLYDGALLTYERLRSDGSRHTDNGGSECGVVEPTGVNEAGE